MRKDKYFRIKNNLTLYPLSLLGVIRGVKDCFQITAFYANRKHYTLSCASSLSYKNAVGFNSELGRVISSDMHVYQIYVKSDNPFCSLCLGCHDAQQWDSFSILIFYLVWVMR